MWPLFVLLSTLGWALVNVLDSLLVRHYEKHPFVLMWAQSLFSLVVLAIMPFFLDVQTSWWLVLSAFGILAFLGDVWFFHVLDRLDVSVTNAAWPILSIFLAFAGIFFFGESWTIHQTVGALLILGGSFFLSFHNQYVSLTKTFGLIVTLALLYAPYYILKKAAIHAGEPSLAVFYWLILGRELLAFTVGWTVPSARTRIRSLIRKMDVRFLLIGGAVIVFFFAGEYFGTLSYSGPLSLVSMVSNVQPFVVIAVAWMFAQLWPRKAPKELLTKQSVGVKALSFTIVFMGLALLVSPQ